MAGTNIGQPPSYFWPYAGRDNSVAGLRKGGREGEYLTDRLTDEAERFIDENKDRPFFLYFPHYAVHMPLQAKPAILKKYKAKPPCGGQKNLVYAAMIESVDQSVGRIQRKLQRWASPSGHSSCSPPTTAACGRRPPPTRPCGRARAFPMKAVSASP